MREHKTPDPTIAVRVSPDMRYWLITAAARHNLKVSDFLRSLIARAMEADRG